MGHRNKTVLYVTAAISVLVIIFFIVSGINSGGGDFPGHVGRREKHVPLDVYKDDVLIYEDILETDKDNIDAYIRVAEAYYKLGELDAAIESLEAGYEATGSKELYDLKCEYETKRDELANKTAVLNNELFGILSDYVYKDYVNKGAKIAESSDDEVILSSDSLNAEIYFRNSPSGTEAVSDGQVKDDAYPSEIILDDPMDLFGGGYMVTFEKLQELGLSRLKVSTEESYPFAVTFSYKGCSVVIESDEDGRIVTGASNHIVPDKYSQQSSGQEGAKKEENYTVSGTVRNGSQGGGISGVHVQFAQNGRVQAEATTGSGGGYSVTLPEGSYSVTASADGYENLYQNLNVSKDTTLNLSLTPNSTPEPTEEPVSNFVVSGTVKDASSGSGISGARLEFNDNEGLVTSGSVRTDGSGRFSITLPKGSYTVSITCENYNSSIQVINVTANKTLNVRLEPAAASSHTISGYAMDANSLGGISGVDITFSGNNGSYSCRTGSDGYYEILVNDGTYTAVLSCGGYAQKSETLTVEFDITMNFMMSPLNTPAPTPEPTPVPEPDPTPVPTPEPAAQYTLSGTVVDAYSGSPLAGAVVYLNNLNTYETVTVSTDGNGNFSVTVPSAEYMVTASCGGYSNASEYVSLNSGASLYFALIPSE